MLINILKNKVQMKCVFLTDTIFRMLFSPQSILNMYVSLHVACPWQKNIAFKLELAFKFSSNYCKIILAKLSTKSAF